MYSMYCNMYTILNWINMSQLEKRLFATGCFCCTCLAQHSCSVEFCILVWREVILSYWNITLMRVIYAWSIFSDIDMKVFVINMKFGHYLQNFHCNVLKFGTCSHHMNREVSYYFSCYVYHFHGKIGYHGYQIDSNT